MKEKTFEELAREKVVNVMGFNVLTENEVIQLMQQVREATIAEVLKLADDNLFNKEPKVKLIGQIEKMKTDRIKLTDK